MKNEEQIVNAVMMWLTFLGIIFGGFLIMLTISILDGIIQILK